MFCNTRQELLGSYLGVFLGNVDDEDTVAARRNRVHVRRSNGAGSIALIQDLHDGLPRRHWPLRQTVDVDTSARVLAHHQVFRLWVIDIQQVADLLTVDLEIRAGDAVRDAAGVGLDPLEDFLGRAWNYALQLVAVLVAHHRPGLASAGLPVGEDRAVVALQHVADADAGALLEDEVLRGVGIERIVEREVARLPIRRVGDSDAVPLDVNLDACSGGRRQ